MYNVSWLKQIRSIYLIAALSLLNWLPVLIVSLVNMSLLVKGIAFILLMSEFVIPILAIAYIIISLQAIINKRGGYLLSFIIIIVNAIYLIWGAIYMIKYFARF